MEILIAIVLGLIAGTVSGIFPGIHINLISSAIISNYLFFAKNFSIGTIVVFIICMGITHTFLDFIPSVLFGVPDSDTALSVLPAHRMVLEGKAFHAIFLSSIGSLMGVGFAFLMSIPFLFFLENIYLFFKSTIPYVLIFVLITLIVMEREKNKIFWAFTIVMFAGSLGMLVLNSNVIDDPLLVLFSGLFGLSTLLYSLRNESRIPEQSFDVNFKFDKGLFKGLFAGGVASSFCAVFPGMGNAQAATISSMFFKNLGSEIFLVVLGSINTINFVLSFLTFFLIERTRNGSVFAISQIIENMRIYDMIFYFALIFAVGIMAFFATLLIGKFFVTHVFKFDLKKINLAVVFILVVFVFILSNVFGFLAFIAATFLGLLCISLGVRRIHLMSVLIVPVVFSLI